MKSKKHNLLVYILFRNALLFIVLISFFFGCHEQQKESIDIKKIELNVLVNESIKDLSIKALNSIIINNPSLSDINLSFSTLSGYQDSEQIADGRAKTDLWLSSSTHSVIYANQNLKNLGAAHKNCITLGSSPFTIITNRETAKRFCDEESECNLPSIIPLLDTPEAKPQFGYQRTLLAVNPAISPLAALAWSNLSLIKSPTDTKSNFEQELKKYFSLLPASNFKNIVDKIVRAERDEQIFGLVPKNSIAINQQSLISEIPFHSNKLELIDQNYFNQILLCSSEGDWVTSQKESAINRLFNELKSLDNINEIKAANYTNTKPRAVNIPESTKSIINQATKNFKLHLLPITYTLLVDASASMEQSGRIYDLQRALRLFIARHSENSKLNNEYPSYNLIRFSSEPSLIGDKNDNQESLFKAIDGLEPVGGSSIFDALVFSYETALKDSINNHHRMIVITDGGDLASKTPLLQLTQMLKKRPNWRSVDLRIVRIRSEEASSQDLSVIAEAANGEYIEVNSADLDNTLITLF